MSRVARARKPDSSAISSRAWSIYLVLGVVATFAYFLLPEIAQGVFNIFIGASAVVALLAGARRQTAVRGLPLYLFAGGLALLTAGDAIYAFYQGVLGVEDPFPSPADAFYLANYPFFVAALVLLVRRRTPGRDWGGITDAAIITTGAGVLSWVFLMKPYADDLTLPLLERLILISYSLMDLLLLALAARLLVAPGARVSAYYFLGLSLILLLISDAYYAVLELADAYEVGHPVDAGYLISYVLLGVTALHPSMPLLSEPGPSLETKLTVRRLVLLATASLAVPGVLAVQAARGEPVEVPVVVGGSVVLFLLVLVRLAGFVRKYERAVDRERILRKAGVALVGALNREAIHAAALEATLELMKNEPKPRAYIAAATGEYLIVETAAGDVVAGTEDIRIDLRDLPDSTYMALIEMRSVEIQVAGAPVLRQNLGGDNGFVTSVLVCPLRGGEELDGALVVVSGSRFSEELKETLETLGSQTSLALESVALAEDLHSRRSGARFRSLVQNASDIIVILDADGYRALRESGGRTDPGLPDRRTDRP